MPSGQAPSPFQPEFSPVMNVQNVDARQIHQQAVFVNEDRSAQVAQIAELRHQAILAEHGQQVAEDARHFRDLVENQAKVAVQESREQIEALANQRLSDMNQAHQNQHLQEQRAYLDRLSLERHTVVENERASAKQREDALALSWRSPGSKAVMSLIHPMLMKRVVINQRKTRKRRALRGAARGSAERNALLPHHHRHPVHQEGVMTQMTQALNHRVLHASFAKS